MTKTKKVNATTSAAPKVSLRDKFADARQALNKALVERGEEIDLALTALIAQEHLLLVGPPGTAKSLVVESIRQWIDGAKSLTVHCCKDTTRNVAFGPVSLKALKEDRTERVLTGGAADVEVLILEEVFKAGPAVLDMFLMLMNERVYREGLVSAEAPLRLLLGVSNEWSPDGCEAALSAFFDRFLFRKSVDQVSARHGRKALLAKAVACDDCRAEFSHNITLAEIDLASVQSELLPLSNPTKQALWKILEELDKEGIRLGDRRMVKAVKAARAYAYLNGHDDVQPEDLEVLKHVLWIDPEEQPKKVAAIVSRIANPIGMRITDLLVQIEEIIGRVVARATAVEAIAKLEEIEKEVNDLPGHSRKETAVDAVKDALKHCQLKAFGMKSGRDE